MTKTQILLMTILQIGRSSAINFKITQTEQ